MSFQTSPGIQPPDPVDERRLAHRARAGDQEAVGALYDRHHARVFTFVQRRVRNRALAEDLTSETFLRALRRMDGFVWQGTSVGAWLITIARNLVADHFRSARFRLEIATGRIPEGGADPSAEDHALRGFACVEARETVRVAIRRLSPAQRRCVEMRFLQELPLDETARALGCSYGAVKTLQFRALSTLRKAVEPS